MSYHHCLVFVYWDDDMDTIHCHRPETSELSLFSHSTFMGTFSFMQTHRFRVKTSTLMKM